MKGYVICQDTLCGVVIDWLTNEDGSESPDVYTDSRDAAREILDQRIAWLESRKENIDGIDEDDCDEANGEAGDDLDLWIEPVTIEGEGEDATIQLGCWDEPESLARFYRDNGRNDRLRWPVDYTQGGEHHIPVPTQNGG